MKIVAPKSFYFDKGPKTIVLLHSLSGTPNDMRLLGRDLERNNYSVYAPMFAGHGTREPLDILNQGGPDVWWKQAEQAITYLQGQGKTQIYFFGLSLGAIFATKALEKRADVIAGGTFGSPLYNEDFHNVRQAFITYSKKVYALNEMPQETVDEKMAEIDSRIDGFLDSLQETTAQVTDQLVNLTKPYFIGQGTEDYMVNTDGAYQAARACVKSDLHWYNAGHVLTINDAHKELQSDVLNFLEKIEDRNA